MDRHYVQQVCPFFATKFSLHERSRDSPFNILILGSPVLGGAITRERRAYLRELQDLYLRPDPVPQPADLPSTVAPEITTVINASTSESGRASSQAQNAQLNTPDTFQRRQEGRAPRGDISPP